MPCRFAADFKVGEGDWADASLAANEVQVRFKLALADLAPFQSPISPSENCR